MRGRLWPRQRPRNSVLVIQSHAPRCAAWFDHPMGPSTKGWLLFELLIGVARNGSRSTFFLFSSACLLKKLIPSWKRCKTVTLKAWQSWTYFGPNVPWKTSDVSRFWYDRSILSEVFAHFTKPLGLLPPYLISFIFDQAAAIFNKYPPSSLSTASTQSEMASKHWGFNCGDSVLKNGFGGIAGNNKPTANVHALYQRLNPEIQIVGTGGLWLVVRCLNISCGASMVQIGTTRIKKRVGAFERITAEPGSHHGRKDISLKTSVEIALHYQSFEKNFSSGNLGKFFIFPRQEREHLSLVLGISYFIEKKVY